MKKYFVKYRRESGVEQIARFDAGDKRTWISLIIMAREITRMELISFGTGDWENE